MNKYLTKIAGSQSKGLAVVIKGNPKYTELPEIKPMADRFYNEISDRLKKKGYTTEFATSEPYTCPNLSAKVWVAHSRGFDRLRFAEGQITMEMKTLTNQGLDPGHYTLSKEDLQKLDTL